jgi:hypothetical protein
VLTLGPYAGLILIVAGFWLFIITLALACIVAGAIGERIARRHGRKCPACDYRADPVDMVIHHALDHDQGG